MKNLLHNNTKIKKSKKAGAFLFFLSIFVLGNDLQAEQLTHNSGAYYVAQQINTKNVTINLTNVPVKEILYAMQNQTGLSFIFDDKELSALKSMTFRAQNMPLKQALDNLFKDTDFSYKIIDSGISIFKKTTQSTKKAEVKGKVIDEDGNPVAGATLIIVGTDDGAITDEKGNFKLNLLPNAELECSFVGLQTLVQKVQSTQKDIVIKMLRDVLAVDDVVVTGIFNKAKESYTGSVTTITAKDMKMFRGSNVLSTIKNIDPSLNIVQNNNLGSDPNSLPEINIRGNSSLPTSVEELNQGANAQLNAPLVIMDGFEITLQKLMDFNDEEIESINIMKDAAATAIYGSRGANGVIVVVTKAPVPGKLKLFVQGGVNIEMPDLSSYDLLNAADKLQLEKNIGIYGHNLENPSINAERQYNDNLRNVLNGVNTYWLSKPLRVGIGQKYNARLEGGSNEFRWGVSLGYNHVNGVMKGSSKKVFDGAISLSYHFKNLIFKNQTMLTNTDGANSPYGAFSDYTKMNPYWKTHDDNGNLIKTYSNNATTGSTVANPLYNAEINTRNTNNNIDLINNFSVEWEAVKNLRLRAKLGVQKNFNSSDDFKPAEHTDFEDYDLADYMRRGKYKYGTGQGMNLDASATASYSNTFANKHQIYVGVDYSILEKKDYGYNFVTEGYHNAEFDFLPNAVQYETSGKPDGSESIRRSIGLTANASYTFDNRYFVDISYRIDGASQFGTKNRFAPFWSTGIGWNLHREKFLQDNKVINNLRLKASYGTSGSQQFSAYKALTTYKYDTNDRYMSWSSARLMGIGNEDLRWQTTRQYNIGFEAGLWHNRLVASIDAYNKMTDNLLSEMYIPYATGFASYTDNVGAIKNSGFEASLSGFLIRSNEFSWNITAKLAYNKNIVSELSEAIKAQTAEYIKQDKDRTELLFEGDPRYAIYAVRSLGIDPSNGQEIFLDNGGNPTYDWKSSYRTFVGVSDPKYRGNINTSFMYKNFTLNLSFGYHWGGQQYNETLKNRVEVTAKQALYNVDRRVLEERWMKPGDVTFFKGFFLPNGSETPATRYSSRFVQNDNMFSLQSANVRYRWTGEWLKKNMRAQAIDLSANMTDIFYVSTIKRERGLSYPFARRMTFTVSLLF